MSWRDDADDPFVAEQGPEPRPVADLLGRVGRRRGWAERLRGARVHEAWERIAGAQLAEHVVPVRLAGGVLVVRARSSAWATQVRYLAADLAEAANRELGDGTVTQVTVVVGDVDARDP